MRLTYLIPSVVTLLSSAVSAHYGFLRLQINDTIPNVFEYIRPFPGGNVPLLDLDSPDFRCNVNGSHSNTTATATIRAGESVTWIPEPRIYHPGPVSVFLSKVANASTARGDGDWFKILDIGPRLSGRGGDWAEAMTDRVDVELPDCLPEGDYLMRIQHAAIHMPGRPVQMHVACAQLRLRPGRERRGMGPGKLPPWARMIKIPGRELGRRQKGWNQNIFVSFTAYEVPGGKVWTCEE